jgi:hypothetical protein
MLLKKIVVNRFDHIECQDTRDTFNTSKLDIVGINDLFIDPQLLNHMFQCDSFHDIRLRMGRPSPFSWKEIPPTSNGELMVQSTLWSPFMSSLSWRRLRLT